MGRKVVVGLEADVGKFIPPVEASKKAVDGLDRSVEALDRDLNKVPADAAKAAAAMKLLGGDINGTAGKLDTISDKSSALTVLDAKIKASRREVRELGDEFVRTGNVDVFAKLRDADVMLRGLIDVRKRVAADLKSQGGTSIFGSLVEDAGKSGAQAGSTFASLFQGGIIKMFMALPSEVQAVLVVVAALLAAVLASAIGAALNGAILGALGGGLLVGAIIAQANDPSVSAAFSALGKRIGNDFATAARPAIAPLAYSAAIFEQAWRQSISKIDAELIELSKFIVPLASGIAAMFTNAQPGFLKGLEAAGPILQTIADELPGLGNAISRALSAMSGSSEGAVEGMRTLFKIIDTGIVVVGYLIAGLSTMYEWLIAAGDASFRFADSLLGWVPILGPFLGRMKKNFDDVKNGADHVTDSLDKNNTEAKKGITTYEEFAQRLSRTAETMDTVAGKMVDKLFSATMGLDQANLHFHQSLTSVNESIKENGRSLDINTAKGQSNIGAIYASVQANMEQYQATLKVTGSAQLAAEAYDANTRALEAQLRKAGFTQQAIDGLIGKYRAIPDQVNTDIAIHGLTEAINNLDETLRLINGLPSRKEITVTTRFITIGKPAQTEGNRPGNFNAEGGIRRAQRGLIIPPADPGVVLAAEPQTGGEALIPLQGISQRRAYDLLQIAGAGYGLEVSPRWRSTSGPMASAPMPAGGYTDLGPLLAEVRGLRGALAGMGVYLDGQRVGYVQGQQADRYRRGG